MVLVNRYMVGKGNGSTLRVTPSEVVFLVVTLEGMEATEVVPFVPSFPVVHSSMLVAGMAEVLKWHYYALIRLLYSVLFASVPSKFMIGIPLSFYFTLKLNHKNVM